MGNFTNNPNIRNNEGENSVKRYVHQPLTVEHYGLHAKIQEDGKVIITGVPVKLKDSDEYEWDEVTVQAPFIFELASILKATRSVDKIGENRRYTHQPLVVERFGVTASIQTNGKIMISQLSKNDKGEHLKDEVEISASLIFKLITLLRASRKTEFVSVADAPNFASTEDKE